MQNIHVTHVHNTYKNTHTHMCALMRTHTNRLKVLRRYSCSVKPILSFTVPMMNSVEKQPKGKTFVHCAISIPAPWPCWFWAAGEAGCPAIKKVWRKRLLEARKQRVRTRMQPTFHEIFPPHRHHLPQFVKVAGAARERSRQLVSLGGMLHI